VWQKRNDDREARVPTTEKARNLPQSTVPSGQKGDCVSVTLYTYSMIPSTLRKPQQKNVMPSNTRKTDIVL
jgi:hypothetical protein